MLTPSYTHNEVSRFFGRFLIGLLVFELLYYGVLLQGGGIGSVLRANASLAGAVYGWLGREVWVDGVVLQGEDFRVIVQRGCDGLQPLGILLAALLSLPTGWRNRFAAMVVGTAFVLALNLARLLSLCQVAAEWPESFELVHLDLWQPAFLAMTLLFWLVWALRSLPRGPFAEEIRCPA
ncbi:MAG: archaeosortase/exosortase family protein [Planctomycetota bacterium]